MTHGYGIKNSAWKMCASCGRAREWAIGRKRVRGMASKSKVMPCFSDEYADNKHNWLWNGKGAIIDGIRIYNINRNINPSFTYFRVFRAFHIAYLYIIAIVWKQQSRGNLILCPKKEETNSFFCIQFQFTAIRDHSFGCCVRIETLQIYLYIYSTNQL